MTYYMEILSVQRPFPIGYDDNNRIVYSVNFLALAKAPVEGWEEDLVKLLIAAGIGANVMIGIQSVAPPGAGPFTTVIDTSGGQPAETHNGDVYERLSAQVVVRATNLVTARTRALAVWRAIHGTRNTTIA